MHCPCGGDARMPDFGYIPRMCRDGNEPTIIVEDLAVRRGGRMVLDGIDFTVSAGESLAIVGPNGAGKTTLMLAMMGLLPLERGSVVLNGRDIRKYTRRKSIARSIAYVPQQYAGFVGFTVDDMVAAGRYAHQGPFALHTAHDRRIIAEALAAGGLTDMRDRIVSQLSAGERQKVLLAAAMAQQSPILFLDEPTTALDPKHQVELVGLLRRLHQSGKTLVVICHDLNLALALQARVLALRDGQLLHDEQIECFIKQGGLGEVFEVEFEALSSSDGQTKVLPRI